MRGNTEGHGVTWGGDGIACAKMDPLVSSLHLSVLDSTSAPYSLSTAVASSGVSVLLSIHQPKPDILRMLDCLVLLSSNGECIFSGPMSAAEPLFSPMGLGIGAPRAPDMTVADVLLDAAIRKPERVVEEMAETYRKSQLL